MVAKVARAAKEMPGRDRLSRPRSHRPARALGAKVGRLHARVEAEVRREVEAPHDGVEILEDLGGGRKPLALPPLAPGEGKGVHLRV